MTGPVSRWRNTLVALVLAVPVGVAGGYAMDAHQHREHAEARATYDEWESSPAPSVPEQLEGLLDDLAEDRVIVAHDVADLIGSAQLDEARTTLQKASVPSYLAYVREPLDGDYGYREEGVLRLMEDAVDGPAYLVVLTSRGRVATREVGLHSRSISREVGAGRPGNALVAVARHQVMEPPDPLEEIAEVDPQDYWGGRSGGVLVGGLFGGLVVAPLAFGVDYLWRRRRPQELTSKQRNRKGRVLP